LGVDLRRADVRGDDLVRAERDHVAALIDSLGDGVLEADMTTWRYLHVNAAFCKMVGMTADEVFAFDARDDPPWVPEHQRPIAVNLMRRVRRGEAARDHIVMRHGDGSEFPAFVTLSLVLTDTDSPHVVADVRDLTEDRRIAAELADARAAVRVADERDRIARDLHDRVIQGLFAAGLHLEAAACRLDDPAPVLAVVDEIDAAITEIRSSIFTLHRPRGLSTGLQGVLLACADEASRLLGHQPVVTLRGPWQQVGLELIADCGAVARELLSNVAKHAGAASSWLTVDVEEGHLQLTVEDDGVGVDHAARSRGDGLQNLIERAHQRLGNALVERRQPAGTVVTWKVPLSA
jgi:PAS domain S-box-containing protein